jgi:molecular chaperone HtpG
MRYTMTREGFETNIPELIRRLGLNLYNDPTISLRELVQNANDACILAEGMLGAARGRIDVTVNARNHELVVTDNGTGMTAEDLRRFLSTIASTRKSEMRRELEARHFDAASGIAGQFGIGFLSTFIIAKEVRVHTRHQRDTRGPGSVWVSGGDGFYEISASPHPLPYGTSVTLVLKEDFWNKITTLAVAEALSTYCPFIRTPYYINDSSLPANHEPPPWSDPANQGLADAYLRSSFDMQPLVNFHFSHRGPATFTGQTLPDLRVQGYLAIPSHAMWGGGRPRVYTSGLYVGEIKDGLPSWANFITGGIECPDLDLTLGRDNVMNNVTWRAVQAVVARELTAAMVRDLSDRRSRLRRRWERVFRVHDEAIMRAAVDDSKWGSGEFYKAVRELIPFRIAGERVSIAEAVKQGKCLEKDGRKMFFYLGHGTRQNESAGIQEALLFDEVGLHFIDARNYYERDLIQRYDRDSAGIAFVPIEEGLEYILDFNCDAASGGIITDTYQSLGLNARLSKFKPDELAAVIIPLGGQSEPSDNDDDLATPESRDRFLRLLMGLGDNGAYRPYALCVNANNILVQELLKYATEHGVDSYIKAAFNQVYYMAVLVFGDTNTQVVAEMAPGLSSLMLSFLRRSTDQESELQRLRGMLADERERLAVVESQLIQRGGMERRPNTVFLAYGYDEPTKRLVKPFVGMLEKRGIAVIDGMVDRVGSLSSQILDRIRTSSLFVGVLTTRDRLASDGSPTTSTWVLEEKGAARGSGVPVLLIMDRSISTDSYANIEGDSVRLVSGGTRREWSVTFEQAAEMIARSLKSHEEGLESVNSSRGDLIVAT